jgi:pimeloyl-ACP methyl ester carboxylesterase
MSVVAPDLPAEDPAAGLSRYAEIVGDALTPSDDDVVLVGHSLGGKTIPLVAERRPVARLVYLASLPPLPGRSMFESIDDYGVELSDALEPLDDGDGTLSLPSEIPRHWFFHDVPDDLARWAESNLRRQASLPMTERSPLKAQPDVPISFVACTEDRALPATGVRMVAARFNAQVTELPGSHSPFLSRPGALADVLVRLCSPS